LVCHQTISEVYFVRLNGTEQERARHQWASSAYCSLNTCNTSSRRYDGSRHYAFLFYPLQVCCNRHYRMQRPLGDACWWCGEHLAFLKRFEDPLTLNNKHDVSFHGTALTINPTCAIAAIQHDEAQTTLLCRTVRRFSILPRNCEPCQVAS
jgi:hypothetical protein